MAEGIDNTLNMLALLFFFLGGLFNLEKLVQELREVVKDWFVFGLFMKIPYPEMKKIELECGNDIERCKIEMFNFLLQNKNMSNKQQSTLLLVSLKMSGYHSLANRLQSKFGLSCGDLAGK